MESIDFLRDDGDEIPGSNSAALPPHTAPHQSITLPEYSTELSTNNHIYPLFSEVTQLYQVVEHSANNRFNDQFTFLES